MQRSPKQSTYARGLTLVETIVVLSLFLILMLAVSQSIASFYRLNAYTIAQAYQVDTARKGVDDLTRDLREMTYADDGAFPLVSMSSTSVSFFSNVDNDPSVEFVKYALQGTTLMKYVYNATGSPPTYSTSTPQQTKTLSEYVQNTLQATPMFVYYGMNGSEATATSTVTDIRYIGMRIIVNIDPVRDPGEYMLRSSAALRNLSQI